MVRRFPQWGPIFRVTFELKINSATKLLDDWDGSVESNRSRCRPYLEIAFQRFGSTPLKWQMSSVGQIQLVWEWSYISSTDEGVHLNISWHRFITIDSLQILPNGRRMAFISTTSLYMENSGKVWMPNQTPANFTNVNVFTMTTSMP